MTIEQFGSKVISTKRGKAGLTRQGVYHLLMRKNVSESIVRNICTVLGVDRKLFLVTDNVTSDTIHASDSEKEIADLKKVIDEKQKIIDSLERIVLWQEHFFKKSRKSIAHILKSKLQ